MLSSYVLLDRVCQPAAIVKNPLDRTDVSLMKMDVKSYLKAHPSVIGITIAVFILIYVVANIILYQHSP